MCVHRDSDHVNWCIVPSAGTPRDRRAGGLRRALPPGLWFFAQTGEVRYYIVERPGLATREQLLEMPTEDRQRLLDEAVEIPSYAAAAAPRREQRPELRRGLTPARGGLVPPVDKDEIRAKARVSFSAVTASDVLEAAIARASSTEVLDALISDASRVDPSLVAGEAMATRIANRRVQLSAAIAG